MEPLRRAAMVVAALVYLSVVAQSDPSAQARGGSCPLTEAQVDKSIEAFAPIAHFLTTEPRCFNCHGGVNPFMKGFGLDEARLSTPPSKAAHSGGAIRRSTDGTIETECQDCHNHMARQPNGKNSAWMTAPDFLSFVDKDATTLCRQMKRRFPNASDFVGHLKDDNGGPTFAETAFIGDRALDPDVYGDIVRPEPPRLSHAALMQLAQNWIAAMGGSFKGNESCGCEHKHDNWSGQIRFTVQSKTDYSHWDQQDVSGFSLSQVTLTFNNGVGRADSHAEQEGYSENRRHVVDNGQDSLIFDGSSRSQGSMDGRSDATVEVRLLNDGTYRIQPGWSDPAPGKVKYETCWAQERNRICETKEGTLYPDVGVVALTDRISDPNHLTGTSTDSDERTTGFLKVRSVRLRTVTWDLWRSE